MFGNFADWTRILLDNTKQKLQENNILEMPRDLWNIIINYICEDSQIIDIITKDTHILQTKHGKISVGRATINYFNDYVCLRINNSTIGIHGEVFAHILIDTMVSSCFTGDPKWKEHLEFNGIRYTPMIREFLYKKLEQQVAHGTAGLSVIPRPGRPQYGSGNRL